MKNNNKKPIAVVMVGKTHSGKSTFARMLEEALPDFAILETDPISVFEREFFPKTASLKGESNGDFTEPTLTFKFFQTLVDHALFYKQNIILGNSNMWSDGRTRILKKIHSAGYLSVIVFMNLYEKVLFDRVAYAKRPTNVLTTSKNFDELIIKQRDRLTSPTLDESDYFFEITDVNEIGDVIASISKIIQ